MGLIPECKKLKYVYNFAAPALTIMSMNLRDTVDSSEKWVAGAAKRLNLHRKKLKTALVYMPTSFVMLVRKNSLNDLLMYEN